MTAVESAILAELKRIEIWRHTPFLKMEPDLERRIPDILEPPVSPDDSTRQGIRF